MTPDEFVEGLRVSVQRSADALVDKLAQLPQDKTTAHLVQFAEWYRSQSDASQEVARDLIRYAAGGGLFVALSHLSGSHQLTDQPGELEVWFVDGPDGAGTRLNPPDQPSLIERFNNPPVAE